MISGHSIILLKTLFKLSPSVHQAPVVQKVESAIHWINYYPVDTAIGFPYISASDSVLSGEL